LIGNRGGRRNPKAHVDHEHVIDASNVEGTGDLRGIGRTVYLYVGRPKVHPMGDADHVNAVVKSGGHSGDGCPVSYLVIDGSRSDTTPMNGGV
jgi:hypothetical protein